MTQTTVAPGRTGDSEAPARRRGGVPELSTSRPIAGQLPALFQEDDFCVRLTQALDEVLAPAYLVLDSLDAYIDPDLAPEDFLEWLAGWVGLRPEDLADGTATRTLIGQATSLFRLRGTPAGLARLLEFASGRPVFLEDSGGVRWSPTPDSELPGSPRPFLTVRLGGSPISSSEERTLRRMLQGATPAHVPATLVVDRAVSAPEDPVAEDPVVEDAVAEGGAPEPGTADFELDAEVPEARAEVPSDHEAPRADRSDHRGADEDDAGSRPGDSEERPEQ